MAEQIMERNCSLAQFQKLWWKVSRFFFYYLWLAIAHFFVVAFYKEIVSSPLRLANWYLLTFIWFSRFDLQLLHFLLMERIIIWELFSYIFVRMYTIHDIAKHLSHGASDAKGVTEMFVFHEYFRSWKDPPVEFSSLKQSIVGARSVILIT